MKTFLQHSYAHLNERPTVMHTSPSADVCVFCKLMKEHITSELIEAIYIFRKA